MIFLPTVFFDIYSDAHLALVFFGLFGHQTFTEEEALCWLLGLTGEPGTVYNFKELSVQRGNQMHKSTSVITKISTMREVCTGTNYLSQMSTHTHGRRPTPSDVTEFL